MYSNKNFISFPMSSTKETINEEQKTDNPLILKRKAPNPISKRQMTTHYSAEVKQVKVVEEKKSEPKLCCAHCSKTLKFISTFICRCEKSFCSKHRFFDQHSCTFDFKTSTKEKLRAQNLKIVPKKLRE